MVSCHVAGVGVEVCGESFDTIARTTRREPLLVWAHRDLAWNPDAWPFAVKWLICFSMRNMSLFIFLVLCLANTDSFKQHEVVVHENLTIEFKEIFTWDKIFEKLVQVVEHNAQNGITHDEHEIQIPLPGLFVKPIWCPKSVNCFGQPDYNFSADYDFQPLALQRHGGVCGVDISPGPPSRSGEVIRLFLLPQLQDRDHTHVDHDKDGIHEGVVLYDKTIEAMEGPRGIIASSNGLVFDLAGGCQGCIKVYPEVGDEFVITNHHTVRHLHHITPVVVAALHSHSETYFHAVSELLPRLYLIMDYIGETYPGYTIPHLLSWVFMCIL